MSRERVSLQGFNNLTKTVNINLFDFHVARTDDERRRYVAELDDRFSAARITEILREIASQIDAEVLSVSAQDYEPQGASALVLMSDQGHTSVGAHLTKSHLCAHTYPDWSDPKGVCTFRVDIEVATCGTIVPLRALDYLLRSFENDVVIIDYIVRGFTRAADGRRVYMDHTVRSIQDFIDPALVGAYHCEDLVLQAENIWQTKMMRSRLDPADYFPAGLDLAAPDNLAALDDVRRDMIGTFYGSPG